MKKSKCKVISIVISVVLAAAVALIGLSYFNVLHISFLDKLFGRNSDTQVTIAENKDSGAAIDQPSDNSAEDNNVGLSIDEAKDLFIKANNLYDGWVCHGFTPVLDNNDKITIDGFEYARITSEEYSSIDELEKELKNYFSEELYKDSLESCYAMRDGKMYGITSLGQGRDCGVDELAIKIDSNSSDKCSFTITFYSENSDPFTSKYEVEKRNGKWIFVNQFAEEWSLYFNNDIKWKN